MQMGHDIHTTLITFAPNDHATLIECPEIREFGRVGDVGKVRKAYGGIQVEVIKASRAESLEKRDRSQGHRVMTGVAVWARKSIFDPTPEKLRNNLALAPVSTVPGVQPSGRPPPKYSPMLACAAGSWRKIRFQILANSRVTSPCVAGYVVRTRGAQAPKPLCELCHGAHLALRRRRQQSRATQSVESLQGILEDPAGVKSRRPLSKAPALWLVDSETSVAWDKVSVGSRKAEATS
ncbi:hypothetical protein BC832DRAFT_541986 [Gaertneriomyces semiglobifer]|nr:hypothetical protein BC832DRAFT_541986 [Gaertneriomyces semiglobifer]